MTKRTVKKKNRKMRRQIRKTIGALFMASAIAVAAIPVTDVSADEAPGTADNYSDYYQSLKVHKTGETGESGSDIHKIYIESRVPGSDSTYTEHDRADGATETMVRYNSTVPVVKEDSTVFVDYQTEGDFRATFYFAISGKSAVILGAEIGSLPIDSDGSRYLTIPDRVIACQLYAVGGKYCAVNIDDEFLYYQMEEDTFIVRGLPDEEAGTNYTLVKRTEVETQSPGDTKGKYYYQGIVDEDTGEVIIHELEAELYERAPYYPCYREDYAVWSGKTLYIYDPNYSYTTGGAVGTALMLEGAAAPSFASASPSASPSEMPSVLPSATPSASPSVLPTALPNGIPTGMPSAVPTEIPTAEPTKIPTTEPTEIPTTEPTEIPTTEPTEIPTTEPTEIPTTEPTEILTTEPTEIPTILPISEPTADGTLLNGDSAPLGDSVNGAEEMQENETASIKELVSETYSYLTDGSIMSENSVAVEQKKLSLNDNLVRKYVSSDFNVNGESERDHLKPVGDSGSYMSLEVNYIGQQYLTDDNTTGEKKIAGLVTSKNAQNGVFAQNSNINILYTGNYLLGIGDYAFYDCTGLSSIQAYKGVNDGLTTIGNGAFAYCMFLKDCNLSLAQNLQVIGMDTFLYCWQLEQLDLPASVQAYGDYCFMGCLGLSDFKFNPNLAYIGYNAFVDCSSLPSIEFPANYREKVPIRYFANCTSVQFIKVQNETCDIIDVWKDGNALTNEENAHDVSNAVNGEPCDIDAFLEALTYDGFYIEGPYNDDRYVIYDTAKKHSVPFSYKDSENLTHYEKTEMCTEYDDAGNEIHSHEIVYDIVVENGVDKLSGIKFDEDCQMTDLILPSNIGGHFITAIEEGGFEGNCYLESITIPASVSLIETNAFRSCHRLKCVTFEHSENDPLIIEPNAFNTQDITYGHNCGEDLDLEPELSFVGVISPDFAAFQYAMGSTFNNSSQADSYISYYSGWPTNLKVVYNPDNPEGQRNELVDYPSYLEIRQEYHLDDYPYITQEMIDAAKEAITYENTANDNSVYQSIRNAGLNVNLPAGITAIAPGLFSGLNSEGEPINENAKTDVYMESITLNTIKEVEPYTFAGCTELTNFYYAGDGSGSGSVVGDYAFKDCTNLTYAEIGSSISEIGIRPFAGCEDLTTENLKFSGTNFAADSNIIFALTDGAKTGVVECLESRTKQVTANELAGITTLWEEAFKNCDDVVSVDLSQSSVATIPAQAFAQMDKLGIITLPSSTTNIGNGAFWNTSSLYSVEIPNDRISIAADAFAHVAAYDSDGKLDVEDGEIDLSSGLASVLSKGSDGARIDDEIGFICSTDSAASNYAKTYYYIETQEVVQVRYYVTPQGVDNAKAVLISTVSVPVDVITDADAWREYKINYEPDLSNSKLWPDYQYPGYTFEGWDDYEYSEDGYYLTYAVYSKIQGVTFLAKDPTNPSASWETVTTVALDDNFEEPNLNDARWSDWHFDGYTFVNWTYSADGTIAYANFSTESITVYFVDVKNTSQGMVSIQITPGSRLSEDDIPVPADMEHFIDWESDDNVDVSIKDRIYENVTFYARYSDVSISPAPTTDPNATPTVDPNATPTATGNPSASVTPTGNPSVSATPTGNPNATATPTNNSNTTATPSTTPITEIVYVNAERTKYTVSVSGGSGSGSYAAGDIVAVNAYYMGEGQVFDKWTTSTAGVGFANANASSTTFTMPAANVAITATYKTGSGTSGTSSGSGNGSNGNNTSTASTGSGTTVEITKPGFSNTGLAGATVSGATDNFIVRVTEDQTATDAAIAALQARYGDLSRIKYFPMDISLYDSTGRTKIADTTGISVNVTLPLPDDLVQYAGNNRIAAVVSNSLEDLNARFTTVDGVPCINFTATHFSPYVIYVDTANLTAGTIDATPKTGDPIHPKWFLAIGMACISLILFFKKDKTRIKAKLA